MLISKFSTENIEQEIEAFEQKHRFTFPDQYRSFLLKYNGGYTPKTSFKVGRNESDIRGLIGLGAAEKYYNYAYHETFISMDEHLANGFLPIAENSFGDSVLLGLAPHNEGKIYFYYHDRPKKYIELAKDFMTFVKKCKSEPIGHIRSIEERRANMAANGRADMITDGLVSLWQAEIDKFKNLHQEELI